MPIHSWLLIGQDWVEFQSHYRFAPNLHQNIPPNLYTTIVREGKPFNNYVTFWDQTDAGISVNQ